MVLLSFKQIKQNHVIRKMQQQNIITIWNKYEYVCEVETLKY